MRIIGGEKRGTKLVTLEGIETRPTLDRIKEALFNKINFDLPDSIVLDLFSGSGALGLESLSRGAKKAYLCDNSVRAQEIIEKNIKKTKFENKSELIRSDYVAALGYFKKNNLKFDIIFLDPPYKTDYNIKALNLILKYNLLNYDGKIIIETDNPNKIIDNITDLNINIYDTRKYGRVSLIFLERKECN